MYEKLIAEMKEQLEYDGYFSGYNVSPRRRLYTESIQAIEELQKPKWVSVTDRLPDFEGYVLCIASIGKDFYGKSLRRQVILYFDYDEQWFYYDEIPVQRECVTYWIPLPQPPKENE